MRLLKLFLIALVVLAMAVPVFAGPYTRTIEIEAYETISYDITVPLVLNSDTGLEELCDAERVQFCATWVKTGRWSGYFSCPEGYTQFLGMCYGAEPICPELSEVTHTFSQTIYEDVVVTEIMLGNSITVRGHIWANKPKPVTYWYVAQKATIPVNAKTVAKSDKIAIPDVDGVFATDSWTFTPKKAGIYRIFLRVLKVDGTMGEIRTKVVVTEPSVE